MQQRSLIFTTLFQSDIIKALTLTQSWATLVASGAKGVETRSWTTKHVGLLAIHAARGFPRWAEEFCDTEPFHDTLEQAGYQKHPEATHNAWNLPLGQIIAIAWLDRVEHITPDYSVSEQERAFGDYSPGRYAWHFSTVYRLTTPIAARGSLGLWNWQPPESFWAEIQAQHEQERSIQ